MEGIVARIVRAMEYADWQGYDGDAMSAVYDEIEQQYGREVAAKAWNKACQEYDRIYQYGEE